MRSFLSIFSRRVKFPDFDSIKQGVGLDQEILEGGTILGFTSEAAFLSSDTPSGAVDPYSCIIETESYIIQHDVRVINHRLTNKGIGDIFGQTTIERLFTEPERINDLPIRDFHLIIWDKTERKLLAFRDQIGVWPLYYYVDDNWLIFSTDIVQIRSLRVVKLMISEDWIADSLVNLHSSATKTFYSNIHLVEPGHVLTSDLRNHREVSYYNLIESFSPGKWEIEEAIEIFRIRLHDSIEKRMSGFASTGSELSGGLDSSAIVSHGHSISQNNGIEFHTFSNVLPTMVRGHYDSKKDESLYGSLVVNELGIVNHHQLFGEGLGILLELKTHLKTMGTPTQQLFTMFSDEIYGKVSELGILQLFSGFGGDEGVSFRGSGFFAEMAHNKKWDIYLKEMKTSYHLQNKPLFIGYANYMIHRYIPFGKDLLAEIKKKKHWKNQKIKGFGYDSQFGQRMQIKSRYLSTKGDHSESSVANIQYQRLIHPYVSRRLTGSFQVGIKYGFSYAFPLLDKDLLEFHLSLPSKYKYNNGIGRVIFREALKGLLPESIRLRNDKQRATVPTVHQRLLRDEEAIRILIKDSQATNHYHYVDYQKLTRWLEIIVRQENKSGMYINPNAFFNSLQILLLQEMERTGEYKTGIYH